jgi:hypothetical protein
MRDHGRVWTDFADGGAAAILRDAAALSLPCPGRVWGQVTLPLALPEPSRRERLRLRVDPVCLDWGLFLYTSPRNTGARSRSPTISANEISARSAGSSQQLLRKPLPEHRVSALGRGSRGLVLDHTPVLDQNAVLHSQDVRSNPIHWLSKARKAPAFA